MQVRVDFRDDVMRDDAQLRCGLQGSSQPRLKGDALRVVCKKSAERDVVQLLHTQQLISVARQKPVSQVSRGISRALGVVGDFICTRFVSGILVLVFYSRTVDGSAVFAVPARLRGSMQSWKRLRVGKSRGPMRAENR